MKLTKKEIRIGIIGLLSGLLIVIIFNMSNDSSGNSGNHIHTEESESKVYTCSMHPQIRQSEPGKCPLCGMDLIAISNQSNDTSENLFVYTMTDEAIALANVQTSKISYSTPEYEVYLTGKIAANEKNLEVISANYSGRVEKLFINFTGQSVSKGDKLATIYSPELITAQKELIEASKNKLTNPLLYDAVREKLRLWKLTGKQIEEIEASGKVLTELDIYADASGIVITRNITTGDYVNRGTILFEIADLSNVWVMFDAYEQDIPWINAGDKIRFTVTSLPGKEFTSTVTFIDPLLNPLTRTVSVRTESSNPGYQLKPEMFAQGKLKSRLSLEGINSGKSLLIPKTSVLWTGKRSIVYVKVPGKLSPTFEMRTVNLGPRASEFFVVESGLEAGEEIVTNGVFAVDAAAQLNGNYSMMNQPVSKRISVPLQFKSQLTEFVKLYFDIKNALVTDDFEKTKFSGEKLLAAIKSANMSASIEKANNSWNEKSNKVIEALSMILKSKNIEEQRVYFEPLSDALIESVDEFGVNNDIVFVQYCPMAFDDKGAYWLSESSDILNPYFGASMLRCGEITKRINR